MTEEEMAAGDGTTGYLCRGSRHGLGHADRLNEAGKGKSWM